MARSPRRAVLLLGLLWRCAAAAAAPQECAVCEDTIGHLAASAAARQRSEAGVRAVLDAYCAQDRLRTAEAQMCYVLEPMRQQVSAWVALGVDAKRTCAKINRMNGEACALFHESKVGGQNDPDWVSTGRMTAKRRAIVYRRRRRRRLAVFRPASSWPFFDSSLGPCRCFGRTTYGFRTRRDGGVGPASKTRFACGFELHVACLRFARAYRETTERPHGSGAAAPSKKTQFSKQRCNPARPK